MSGRNWKIREVPRVVFHDQGVRVVAVFQHDVECPIWNGWTLGEDQWKEADALCEQNCHWVPRVEIAKGEDAMGQAIYLPPKGKQEIQSVLNVLVDHFMRIRGEER